MKTHTILFFFLTPLLANEEANIYTDPEPLVVEEKALVSPAEGIFLTKEAGNNFSDGGDFLRSIPVMALMIGRDYFLRKPSLISTMPKLITRWTITL